MPSLRVQMPGQGPTVYHLYKKLTSIGSAPENDIVLPDPLLAEAFAQVHFDGQTYTITTLSRKADMVVNGKKRKKHKLSHQDKLVVGSIEMQFALIDEQGPQGVVAAGWIAVTEDQQGSNVARAAHAIRFAADESSENWVMVSMRSHQPLSVSCNAITKPITMPSMPRQR